MLGLELIYLTGIMIIRVFVKCMLMCALLACASCKQNKNTSGSQEIGRDTLKHANHNRSSLPENQGMVTDLEDVFTPEQELTLREILYSYEYATTKEIAVLSVSDFSGYNDPLSYATDIGRFWGVGKRETDNGLVIVVSKTLRKTAISSGYGAEKVLSDHYLDSLIQHVMIPDFKDGHYYDGVLAAILNIKKVWE